MFGKISMLFLFKGLWWGFLRLFSKEFFNVFLKLLSFIFHIFTILKYKLIILQYLSPSFH